MGYSEEVSARELALSGGGPFRNLEQLWLYYNPLLCKRLFYERLLLSQCDPKIQTVQLFFSSHSLHALHVIT